MNTSKQNKNKSKNKSYFLHLCSLNLKHNYVWAYAIAVIRRTEDIFNTTAVLTHISVVHNVDAALSF